MKQDRTFKTLESLSDGISYVQTAIAKLSGLLLMLGLVTASANLLMKGGLFANLTWLPNGWAITQALAVDANLALVFTFLFSAIAARDWIKSAVYGLIGLMLLFVAAAIMDIESVQEALDMTLAAASLQVHVSISFLTQLRSIVIVLLVAMSGSDGINLMMSTKKSSPPAPPGKAAPLVKKVRVASGKAALAPTNGHSVDNFTRYQQYMVANPGSNAVAAAKALGVSRASIQSYKVKLTKNQNTKSVGNEHDEPSIESTPSSSQLVAYEPSNN